MVEGDLARLAKLYGIALEYVDQAGDPQIISEETVVAVLTAMGVAAETEEDVSHSIVEREQRDWRRVLPPVYVQRQGQVGQVKVHLPQGQEPRLRILTETEQELPAVRVDTTGPTKTIDGEAICEITFEVQASRELSANFEWHLAWPKRFEQGTQARTWPAPENAAALVDIMVPLTFLVPCVVI